MSGPMMVAINNVVFLARLGQLQVNTTAFAPSVAADIPEHTCSIQAFERYQSTLEDFAETMALFKKLLLRDAAYLKNVQTEMQDLDDRAATDMHTPLLR